MAQARRNETPGQPATAAWAVRFRGTAGISDAAWLLSYFGAKAVFRARYLALARCFQNAQQFAMQGLVAGDNPAGRKNVFAAVRIGDVAAGLAHQYHPGRDIPWVQIMLPIEIEASGRHEGEIERCGAEMPQGRDRLVLNR